ncbi:MAG: DUF1565 domain-containing protein, partial [Acidimicrobiia bacterium]|nr:DUF1565 domain-containing protein [Acidimicrobiia bacterium]
EFIAGTSETITTVDTTLDGDIEVRFVNDGDTEVGNRDLTVDHVLVDGQRFDAEAPTTVATGYWDDDSEACGTDPSTPEVDTLLCNGGFRFATIADGAVVVAEVPTASAAVLLPASARFVAADGDDANPGTRDAPWATIQHAVDLAEPGEAVVVRGGTYDESVVIERSGEAGAPIEIRNHPGERPLVRALDGPGFHIQSPDAPIPSLGPGQRLAARPVAHVVVRGFELAGEGNQSSKGWASGVTIDYAHDIRILDHVIHGFPGGGVSSNQSDNLLVEGNRIESVGGLGLTQYSGLSAYQSVLRGGPDIEPGFRIVFRDNVVSEVRTDLTTAGKQFGPDYRSVSDPDDRADDAGSDGHYTDANCVIIDDGRHTQSSPFDPYTGWSLIESNRCTANMGRGIHVFVSDRVVARANTLRRNLAANRLFPLPVPFGFDPWEDYRWTGELNVSRSGEVRFENNLVDSDGAYDRNSWESTDVVFEDNRYVGDVIDTSFSDGAEFRGETTIIED